MINIYLTASFLRQVFGSSILLGVINGAIVVLTIYVLIRFALWIYQVLSSDSLTFIEITPLASTQLTNAQLSSFIKAISSASKKKLSLKSDKLSLEIVSNKSQGLRYIICCSSGRTEAIILNIKSLAPYFKVNKLTRDYLEKVSSDKLTVTQYKLADAYYLPLSVSEPEDDAGVFIKGAMTSLKDKELMSFQIVLRKAPAVAGKKIIDELNSRGRKSLRLPLMLGLVRRMYYLVSRMFLGALHFAKSGEVSRSKKIGEELNDRDKQDAIDKLSGQTYLCSIRLAVSGASAKRREELSNNFSRTLAVIESSRQAITVAKGMLARFGPWKMFKGRSQKVFNKTMLSSLEIASLFNFQESSYAYSGEQTKLLSKNLPLPIGLRDGKNFSTKVGVNNYRGQEAAIGLTNEERQRHVYITGGTGTGKSTVLKYMIKQDILANQGVALIDPHGDLAESVYSLVPKRRQKDVIYFNPRDISHPLNINLLEVDPRLSGDDRLLEQDLITEELVSIFRKLFSKEDSGGHRIEHILRNATATAFYEDNPTIFTVYRLLTNARYREAVLSRVDDLSLVSFWRNEYTPAGSMQRVKLSIGITSKIGRFLRSTITRRILSQPKSSISFDEIINNRKILICNLAKGLIGEDNSQLLGAVIMAKLQLAAYKRADIKEAQRKPFYLYVDEFQNYATNSFLQLLSEGRKYKLLLVMAEQSPSQQDSKYISNILANVGTVVTFRTNSPSDEKLLLPLYEPYLEKGEIMNLPAYNFYIKIAAQAVLEPTSGVTVL